MTKLKIDSIDMEIAIPDVLWVTGIAGLLCGVGGLIVGGIIGAISDIISWRNGTMF